MTLAPSTIDAAPREASSAPPRILTFDSGLGGLTVFSATRSLLPDSECLYVADDAVFPYGRLGESELVERVTMVMERVIPRFRPDAVVIACHTASTLVLPPLRSRWPTLPFVGTVPAIKPAAAASRSRRISVLATPGTVDRVYTRDLVRRFASDCDVTLVGAPRLASLAEAALRGEAVADETMLREIAPAFVDAGGRRTDVVVLACTHYPLLLPALRRLAPWPVEFVDPAPAIARRTAFVLAETGASTAARSAEEGPATAIFTSNAPPGADLARGLATRGLGHVERF